MTRFTKEQLRERAREKVKSLEFAVTQNAFADSRAELEEELELARIALTSLTAEPVLYAAEETLAYANMGEIHLTCLSEPMGDAVIPLYTAPPAPVVPEEKPMPNPLSMYAVDAVAAIAEVRGWNACRAAMLHGAEPVSQTYKLNELSGNSPVTPDGWISCSEQMPDEIGRYWCYVEEQNDLGKSHYQWNCSWNGDKWGSEMMSGKVTHWMPLPEPPQEFNRG
ncbi:DUF551 domain-containing protein [Salmonella enterica]|nr:DUF551 domain-containing protein [Salmonella enterica]